MKHFYLIANAEKENVEHTISLISSYLKERQCTCLIGERVHKGTLPHSRYTNAFDVPPDTEVILVLGGDGTLIQAARDLAGRNIPMFGINLGTLGYMTQISREEEIVPALDELIAGHFHLEPRMMVKGSVMARGEVTEDFALNDIVLTRGGALRTLKFNLYINDEIFNDYAADGMIISTPTGSTAYNMSAGGPIAAPFSELIILTPICPHTLNSRSIVLTCDTRIEIELTGRAEGDQSIVFDGDTIVELSVGDRIRVEKSPIQTTLIKLKQVSFLDNLRDKMARI